MEITIITGLSGAGKSVAIKSMEDLGFFCVDNLPPSLILKMVELGSQSDSTIEHLAVGIDVRGGEFFEDLNDSLNELDRGGISCRIVFLEADDETLIKRFKETRRSHPIHAQGGISESMARERELLQSLRGRADIVIDTSRINVHQLREQLMNMYRSESGATPLEISLVSFGYKHGLPLDADMVFDVRFLPNPYWVDELRELDGSDPRVRDHIMSSVESLQFLERVYELVQFLREKFFREGRRYITLAMGCTGGQHRSVVLVDELASRLTASDWSVNVRHRDVHRR
jgi:RNase adapter protein RapZ